MPLIPCPECRREFSSLATSCPHCGCPAASFGAVPAPAPAVPPPPVTPTQQLWVRLVPGDVMQERVLEVQHQRNLAEITIDGQPLNKDESNGRFGPIPYVPGSHSMKLTLVCRATGSHRKFFRSDYNLRLTLGELRGNDSAELRIAVDRDGTLGDAEFRPRGCGSCR